eukprot:TRINITY_DN55031_c0_g1_i1.p1 TRINITY_DN55031_c0_g1~~TRINITY_DN55031_c0_g1_i1.p1  ORF type:complete len:219 (+),score=34.02 TRINITY_DN55031_c0_g1_i1:107-763(+)
MSEDAPMEQGSDTSHGSGTDSKTGTHAIRSANPNPALQQFLMFNMTEIKASEDQLLSSPSVRSYGSTPTVVNLPPPTVDPIVHQFQPTYAQGPHDHPPSSSFLPSVTNATTSVTTQKFLKYSLRRYDDEKAVYELVSVRTEITTHVRYVTTTEQSPPQRDETALATFDVKTQGSGAESVTEYFNCDGQLIPYTICILVDLVAPPTTTTNNTTNETTNN